MRLSPLDPNSGGLLNGMAHAMYMTGHFEEALALTAQATQEPLIIPIARIAAASAALAGRADEARSLLERFLKLDPARRLSNLEAIIGPYRCRDDIERYKEGLRLAGLPE